MTAIFKWYTYRFGENGNVSAIPDTAQPAGELSLQEGWGSNYDLDLATQAGALSIERTQHNQLWGDITGNINFWQQNLYPLYTPAADNGGVAVSYAFATRVRYNAGAGEKVYEVIDAAGTTGLPTVAADWVLVDSAYPRSGTAGSQQRTNAQNEALFQDTGDYRASADNAGMVARGFTLAGIPPLEEVQTSTTGNFVAYGSYPSAFIGAMTTDQINGDIFVTSSTVIYKSAGGTGPFTAIGSYPGTGATGIDVDWITKDVFVSDNSTNVYRLPGGTGTFALFGSYASVVGVGITTDVGVDQNSHDVVVSDISIDRLIISRGGNSNFSIMELAPPDASAIAIDGNGNYFTIGSSGTIHRSYKGESPYVLVGTIPTGNNPNNFGIDSIRGIVYMSVPTDDIVYSMSVDGGAPVAVGAYPLSGLISVAVDSGRGHVYSGDSTQVFHRLEGVIDSAAANWYIKT